MANFVDFMIFSSCIQGLGNSNSVLCREELRCVISTSYSDPELEISGNMRPRSCAAYHIERSIATRLGLLEYPCACTRCRGARIKKIEMVARHHRLHGRDRYLLYPVLVNLNVGTTDMVVCEVFFEVHVC